MSNRKLTNEQIGYLIGRAFFLLVAVLFVYHGLIANHPCDIDKQYLTCRLTGSFFDWFGGLIFFAGLVWMSGLIKGAKNLYSAPGSTSGNLIVFVILLISVFLFWNL